MSSKTRAARVLLSVIGLAPVLAPAAVAGTVLTDPSQFTFDKALFDFETFPNGAIVPYITQDLDDEWAAEGLVISDDSAADGASAYSSTYGIPPVSGSRALSDSMNTSGGWIQFTFAHPVPEAGIWVLNGDLGSQVDFRDVAGQTIASVVTQQNVQFVGLLELGGIASLRVTDPDYYLVDDLYVAESCGDFHGAGCPGSGGFTPSLNVGVCAAAGAPVAFQVQQALGGSQMLLLFGAGPAALPMAGGCTLSVAPLFPLIIPLPLGGAGPGSGVATLAGTLPAGTSGVQFGMQAFIVDPGVAHGFAASNGLLLAIQ